MGLFENDSWLDLNLGEVNDMYLDGKSLILFRLYY